MCIDVLTNKNDIAELFSEKYSLIPDDSDSQAHNSDGFSDNVPDTETSWGYFQDNLDESLIKFNSLISCDNVLSCH